MTEHKRPAIRTQLGSSKTMTGDKASYNRKEKYLADKLGGHRQPLSGALDHAKGDISLDKILLDSKQSNGTTITVAGRDLTKITREATQVGKEPGMVLTIEQIPDTTPKEWVMVPLDVFADLIDNQKGE